MKYFVAIILFIIFFTGLGLFIFQPTIVKVKGFKVISEENCSIDIETTTSLTHMGFLESVGSPYRVMLFMNEGDLLDKPTSIEIKIDEGQVMLFKDTAIQSFSGGFVIKISDLPTSAFDVHANFPSMSCTSNISPHQSRKFILRRFYA